jgi:predicted phage terminase large subunit-like protein
MTDLSAGFLQVLRAECEASFAFFARYFFKARKGTKFQLSDHHEQIVRDLEDLFHGRVQNLIINCPPRYSKTELCIVLFVAWCYAKNPQCEFMHLSYSSTLAMVNSDAIREVLKSKEFQQLWPDLAIKPNADSKQAWDTTAGGRFYAQHAGGSVTGFGAGRMDEWDGETFKFSGCLLVDDPLKPDDARHDTLREGVNRRWSETIQSRRNSPRTPTLCIMQRIHKADFTATLASDPDFIAAPGGFRHTKMQALIDEGLPTERSLWPAKHSVQALKAMRDKRNERGDVNPVAKESFDAQYQQEPTPIGGGLIKETWWRYYSDRDQVLQRCTAFWITADTAYTEDTANDPTALQLWGAEGVKRLYLIDRLHGWWEFPDLIKKANAFWAKWPRAKRFYIENKATGISLAQTIKKNRVRDDGSVVLWKPKAYGYPEDKVGRMKEWSHQVHGGVVWLPDPDLYPEVGADAFVKEHSEFTQNDTHEHDDDCDAATMAGSIWTKKGGGVRTKLTDQKS